MIALEVTRNADGTFEVFYNGEHVRSGVAERWLNEELARYGFCGDEYDLILKQLNQRGHAVLRY